MVEVAAEAVIKAEEIVIPVLPEPKPQEEKKQDDSLIKCLIKAYEGREMPQEVAEQIAKHREDPQIKANLLSEMRRALTRLQKVE